MTHLIERIDVAYLITHQASSDENLNDVNQSIFTGIKCYFNVSPYICILLYFLYCRENQNSTPHKDFTKKNHTYHSHIIIDLCLELVPYALPFILSLLICYASQLALIWYYIYLLLKCVVQLWRIFLTNRQKVSFVVLENSCWQLHGW